MRNDNRMLHSCDLRCRKVSYIASDFSTNKCIHNVFTVHQYISCKVQDHNALFHQTDGILIDHTLCIFQCRYMDCDIITLLVDLIYILSVMDTS